MSGLERRDETPNARALDALIGEAREHLDPPDVDWSRLESQVMASAAREKPALVRDIESASHARLFRVGAFVLAAAAAIALFVRREADAPLGGPARTAATEGAPASSLRSTEGAGEVRIGGIVATPGYIVRSGDAIEVDRARGVFERARRVSWLLEQDGDGLARVQVKSAGDSLVLGLERGAIEAQVVPVPSGEAFAVDIATERTLVRVAVHGTHLRVARAGNRVIVDLTEGVVSIGVPPRSGITIGTTITAPAHVELDATDLGTLRVDHMLATVRSAVPLASAVESVRPEAALAPAQNAGAVPPVVSVPKTLSREGHALGPAKSDLQPKAPLPPREAIAAAVRECAAPRSRSNEVHVTVSSSLQLSVSAAGVIESAQFSPPLSPDVQACAAEVIYKVHLDETGPITIPLEFSY